MKSLSRVTLCCLLLLVSACAKTQSTQVDSHNPSILSANQNELKNQNTSDTVSTPPSDYDDYGYFEDYEVEEYPDPFMPWNKFWYKCNDFVLLKVAKPVHQGYTKVVAKTFRNGLGHFKYNMNAPIRMGNAILQAEFAQFFIELGRFIVNVTTSAGFADVAAQNKPLFTHTPQNLRFGYTLAKWHVPQGPYLILPLYGPSTIRESVGTVGDLVADPLAYTMSWEVSFSVGSLLLVNDFEKLYTTYENFKEISFDPYTSLRNAYLDKLNFNEPK